jgi:hypothetical protein
MLKCFLYHGKVFRCIDWPVPYNNISFSLNNWSYYFFNILSTILIISMVEDVKGRGGSGYVVKKDRLVLEEWFSSN